MNATKYQVVLLSCSMLATPLVAETGMPRIINGDFESGLTGWTVALEGGRWYSKADLGTPVPAPISATELAFLVNGKYGSLALPAMHESGGHYLRLEAPSEGSLDYTDPAGHEYLWHSNPGSPCTATASQGFFGVKDQVLSGRAQFVPWDLIAGDSASVQVTGPGVNNRVWFMDIPLAESTYGWTNSAIAPTPFLAWDWTCPADGEYTVTLASYNDAQDPSWSHFDDILIVPEPSVIGLSSVAGLMACRLRRRIPNAR